jgi:hypothetical protein
MSKYSKFTAWLIAAWFLFSLIVSAFHLYRTGPDQPPLPLGLAAVIPIATFLAWFAASPRFREFTQSLNPRALTMVQSWRVEAFVFLVLAKYGILPYFFALPAGLGDMAIGATAPLVAMKLADGKRPKGFIFWQLLGMTDLVTAVTLATLARFINPHGVPTNAMTELPMSLIPTFAVPLLFILHFICIAQALRWPAQHIRLAEPLPQVAQ